MILLCISAVLMSKGRKRYNHFVQRGTDVTLKCDDISNVDVDITCVTLLKTYALQFYSSLEWSFGCRWSLKDGDDLAHAHGICKEHSLVLRNVIKNMSIECKAKLGHNEYVRHNVYVTGECDSSN